MFKNNIRELREVNCLSQLELSYMTRISPSAISLLEAGKQFPHPGWKTRIAKALGVEEAALFPE